MTIEISAFRWAPEFAHGYVKDLRVRWALEEAGLAYEVLLTDEADRGSAAYRRRQPFGLVPAFRDGEVELFESAAIVQHLAARSEALAPADPAGRARVSSWIFAAVSTIEPHVDAINQVNMFHVGEAWTQERRPQVEARLRERLDALAVWLGERDYLEGRFTAGDLVMTMVLRELGDWPGLADYPALSAYYRWGEARPAFGRALEAQLDTYRRNAPAQS